MAKGKSSKTKNKGVYKQHASIDLRDVTPDEITTFAAIIDSAKGSGQFEAIIHKTGERVKTLVPGSFRKRVWVKIGDVVFIQIERDLVGANCFIRHVYTSDEVRDLRISFIDKTNIEDAIFDTDVYEDEETMFDNI